MCVLVVPVTWLGNCVLGSCLMHLIPCRRLLRARVVSGKNASVLRRGGGGDDSAVLPLVHNVEQTDTAMSDADPLVFPSNEDEDQMTASFFRNNFFERIVTGYTTTSDVSQRLRESMHLTLDTAGVMWTADNCMYVPDADDLHKECFDSVHSHPFSGHYGELRTLKKGQKLFYWPAMAKDLKRWTKACDSCQRIKARKTAPPGKLQPLEILADVQRP